MSQLTNCSQQTDTWRIRRRGRFYTWAMKKKKKNKPSRVENESVYQPLAMVEPLESWHSPSPSRRMSGPPLRPKQARSSSGGLPLQPVRASSGRIKATPQFTPAPKQPAGPPAALICTCAGSADPVCPPRTGLSRLQAFSLPHRGMLCWAKEHFPI